jgi:hypothetical protein
MTGDYGLEALLDPENAPAGHGIWRPEEHHGRPEKQDAIWLTDDDGCSLYVETAEVAALVNRLIGRDAGIGGMEYRWGYRDGLQAQSVKVKLAHQKQPVAKVTGITETEDGLTIEAAPFSKEDAEFMREWDWDLPHFGLDYETAYQRGWDAGYRHPLDKKRLAEALWRTRPNFYPRAWPNDDPDEIGPSPVEDAEAIAAAYREGSDA